MAGQPSLSIAATTRPFDFATAGIVSSTVRRFGMIYDLTAPPVANDDPGLPALQTSLGSIAPNPFADSATISYSLKDSAPANLAVYNLKGQLVKTLVAETKAAGTHQLCWDGLDASGNQVANGAYLLRLSSGQDVSTRKIMLIR